MDGNRFDKLARAAAAAPSRRALIKAALGGALALAGLDRAEAARLRDPGEVCRKNGDCATNNCGPKDQYGRQRCLCNGPSDCPAGDQCRTATCTAGVCGITVNVGVSCNDGNACTTGETCQANGKCGGGTAVVCTPSDVCHSAACNPATGQCVQTPLTGPSCNADNNACTVDTCQNGVCTAGAPVVCTPLDACHVAGVCDPATGLCSNPPAPNGTPCDDGNACTQTDTCQNGTCTGSNPVVCTAIDVCHVAGTCDPTTGQCSNPPAANGTPCNDGNACTQTDTCQDGTCTGSNPVICTRLDVCHDIGTCNPATGTCSNPVTPNNQPGGCPSGQVCCSGSCCDGFCSGGSCCFNSGHACSGSGQCCGGNCSGGVCVDL